MSDQVKPFKPVYLPSHVEFIGGGENEDHLRLTPGKSYELVSTVELMTQYYTVLNDDGSTSVDRKECFRVPLIEALEQECTCDSPIHVKLDTHHVGGCDAWEETGYYCASCNSYWTT